MADVKIPTTSRTLHLSRSEDIKRPPKPEPVQNFSQEEFERRIAANALASRLATVAQIKSKDGWLV